MIFSRKSDYALRAVDYLVQFEKEHPESDAKTTTVALAREMDIPYRFLKSIVKELCAANIIKSQRGNLGGIRLARPSRDISIYDVLMAIDAKAVAVNQCTLHAGCPRRPVCRIHEKMTNLQRMINAQLSEIRFSDSF